MKVLSLFSGVGGFDYGLEQAGMETVFQCELDKQCQLILSKHWSHVPKWDDVSTLTGEHILKYAPVIDVVAWGSPCQDLSVAAGAKRAGIDGDRSGLFREGIRIIKELRGLTNGKYPRVSIWENVPGALHSNKGADFGQVLNEMAEAGALVIEWAVLDAVNFGLPQRRKRVFVVALFDSSAAEGCPNPIFSLSESVRGDSSQSGQKKQENSASATRGVADLVSKSEDLTKVVYSFDTQFGSNANIFENVSPTLKASQQSPSVAYFENNEIKIRKTTPIETERLMGWRDDWTSGQVDTQRFKQCGNGVASPVAKWVGEQVLKIFF